VWFGGAGPYKSTDNGQTWTDLKRADSYSGSLVVDPHNPTTLYAVSGPA
jgi:hypothetical protein